MADRVLLGAHDGTHVFRASRPGFDVKNSLLAPEQLSIDSRWEEIGNVLMRGSFQLGASQSQYVYFGITFVNPPLVIAHMSGPNHDLTSWYILDIACYYNFNMELFVWTDRFQVGKGDGGFLGSAPRTIRYVVLRNFYG